MTARARILFLRASILFRRIDLSLTTTGEVNDQLARSENHRWQALPLRYSHQVIWAYRATAGGSLAIKMVPATSAIVLQRRPCRPALGFPKRHLQTSGRLRFIFETHDLLSVENRHQWHKF